MIAGMRKALLERPVLLRSFQPLFSFFQRACPNDQICWPGRVRVSKVVIHIPACCVVLCNRLLAAAAVRRDGFLGTDYPHRPCRSPRAHLHEGLPQVTLHHGTAQHFAGWGNFTRP